ncbi:MAG: DUF2905 domain-containing protein [Pseudomonadota bacterium]|nr:DUF2905 domain-containing protein [Pseudomonadota bacterium]
MAGIFYPVLKKIPLGKLPGDIVFQSGNSSFFFPIMTCIIISLLVSLVLNFFK